MHGGKKEPAEESIENPPLVPGCAHRATTVILAEMSPKMVFVAIPTFRTLAASQNIRGVKALLHFPKSGPVQD